MINIVAELKKHYLIAFNGLYDLIDYCPEDLWTSKHSGYLFAQQILHVIVCSINYMRYKEDTDKLDETIIKKKKELQPDLARPATQVLNKQELKQLYDDFRLKIDNFFYQLDQRISEESFTIKGNNNLSLVLMEIRHIAYHAGQLDCIIRETGIKSPGWGYMS